jgi:protein tyrosine phosphatase
LTEHLCDRCADAPQREWSYKRAHVLAWKYQRIKILWEHKSHIEKDIFFQNGKSCTTRVNVKKKELLFSVLTCSIPSLIEKLFQIKIRVFSIENITILKEREVVQLHYKGWPDFGVPATTRPIRELVHLMHLYQQSLAQRGYSGPAFVHCSAGIGTLNHFL